MAYLCVYDAFTCVYTFPALGRSFPLKAMTWGLQRWQIFSNLAITWGDINKNVGKEWWDVIFSYGRDVYFPICIYIYTILCTFICMAYIYIYMGKHHSMVYKWDKTPWIDIGIWMGENQTINGECGENHVINHLGMVSTTYKNGDLEIVLATSMGVNCLRWGTQIFAGPKFESFEFLMLR